MTEHSRPGQTFPSRIGVREEESDLPDAGGTEQGIGDGVRQDIAVRVTEKSRRVRDRNGTEKQGTSFDETVDVTPESDASAPCHADSR
jgi:hypothetical protein